MSSQAPSTAALARVVAEATRATPGVAGLHRGAVGEIATYGAGGRVDGVRVFSKPTRRAAVHVVARYGRALDELADDVRQRVGEALGAQWPEAAGMPVDVHVADVTVDRQSLPDTAGPEGAEP